ncbi:TetR/AcrR family transcriptional regulator [Cucumibacter marinus]|uniref:TetR/AcrR family transcriptional regulator n=1 Tax=Cucumibacter marinus TaxID=1121252 RepID=UPI00042023BA|nr:TetR/AcrR family transcriptional regulator [Cucumibacter marinus]
MAKAGSLAPEDWIRAGFRALSRGGPQAVRAEAIARDLKVSKGSFYWHFKDLPAFKQAMLDHWQGQATEGIIAAVEAAGENARERLSALVALTTSDLDLPYGGVVVEAAIRDWARHDPKAAAVLAGVEDRRLGFVTGLFAESGVADAAQAARLLYAGLIGLDQLGVFNPASRREDLERLVALLLADAPR